jgi:hypothetical protein
MLVGPASPTRTGFSMPKSRKRSIQAMIGSPAKQNCVTMSTATPI